jgi:hypothetical protein
LVKSLVALDADAPLAGLIDYTLAANDTYDVIDAHVAAIFALESWLSVKSAEPHRAISGQGGGIKGIQHSTLEMIMRDGSG